MATVQSSVPIDLAARNQSRLFVVYVVVLVMGGFAATLFTVLVYRAGNAYQEAVKRDADARISESNAEAKRAGESASLANERAGLADAQAGKANQRAGELETANLTLRGQVATLETAASDAKKDVAVLQKAATDAKAAQQRVETDLTKQQERAANAEKDLLELKQRVIRQNLPRWVILGVGSLEKVLKDKPKGSAEIVFQPEDDEAFRLTMGLEGELSIGGWKIVRTVPISADDPTQVLPMYAKEKLLNFPAFAKVGGLSDVTVLASPADMDRGFPKDDTAAHALLRGLHACGFQSLVAYDERLPSGTVRIIVGTKQ